MNFTLGRGVGENPNNIPNTRPGNSPAWTELNLDGRGNGGGETKDWETKDAARYPDSTQYRPIDTRGKRPKKTAPSGGWWQGAGSTVAHGGSPRHLCKVELSTWE